MPTRSAAGETVRRFEALEADVTHLGDELSSLFELVLDQRARLARLEGAAPGSRRSRRRSRRRKTKKK